MINKIEASEKIKKIIASLIFPVLIIPEVFHFKGQNHLIPEIVKESRIKCKK
jgi:hypothetical protein